MRPEFNSTYLLGLIVAAVLPLILNQDLGSASGSHQVHLPTANAKQDSDGFPILTGPRNGHGQNGNAFELSHDGHFEGNHNSDIATAQPIGEQFVGTNACAYCHKDGHRHPTHAVAGKEYSIWVSKDPHACAYTVLFNEQSVTIGKNLKLQTPPHKNDLCLNCHSTNVPEHNLAIDSQLSVADGVGCESCHGGAANWLVAHKLPDWKYMSPSQKTSLGFVDTDNIAIRARKCVECHIGSAGRDVNHDLIAAGHPRLYFEMAAYQAKIPRHWSRAKDLAINSPTNEARLWVVGQFVSAAAALDLLHQRVANADSPWPEFGEYGCFSCHHNLAEERWKTDENFFANGVGKLEWGSWHFSTLDILSNDLRLSGAIELANEIQLVRDLMQERLPDRDQVAARSRELSSRLQELANQVSVTPLDELATLNLSDRLFVRDAKIETLNWDVLTQRYLAAVALRQGVMDSRWSNGTFSGFAFEDSKRQLLEIRDALKYEQGLNSPRKLPTSERGEIYESFSAVFDQLKN